MLETAYKESQETVRQLENDVARYVLKQLNEREYKSKQYLSCL